MLRAALFDLDDTLYDREAAIRRFAEDQHRRFELATSVDLYVEEFVILDTRGRVWKDQVYAELVVRHNLSIPADELLADYVEWFHSQCNPHPGLRTKLSELKSHGLKLGVITNGRSGFQQKTLAALSVTHLFDTVIVSAEVGFRKPDPEIFQLALSNLGVLPEEAVMFGDDAVADVAGAEAVGIQAHLVTAGDGSWLVGLDGLVD